METFRYRYHPLELHHGNVERLRIKSDGKFGVGDFTANIVSQAFHVKFLTVELKSFAMSILIMRL